MAKDNFWHVQGIWDRVTRDSSFARWSGAVAATQDSGHLDLEGGELSTILLKLLETRGSLESYEISRELGKDHQHVVGAIKSIHSQGEVSSKLD